MITDTPNDNARTLQSYQDQTQAYVDGTPAIDEATKAWIDRSLSLVPTAAKILEVGSGFGRDAEYVKQKGFDIECSDAVPNFVNLLQKKGFDTRLIDLLADDLGNNYDLILADAVLLHFTPEESAQVIKKIYAALDKQGVFALTMKQGNGPVWSDEKLGEPRYFYYWAMGDLKKLLTDCGFEWITMSENYTAHNNAHWMLITVRKI